MSEGAGGSDGASAAENAVPAVPSTLEERCQGRRVIVVLKRVSRACLARGGLDVSRILCAAESLRLWWERGGRARLNRLLLFISVINQLRLRPVLQL